MKDVQNFEVRVINMLLELRLEGVKTLDFDNTLYALGHMMNSGKWYFRLLEKKNNNLFISKDEVNYYNNYLKNYCKVGAEQKWAFHVFENAHYLANKR